MSAQSAIFNPSQTTSAATGDGFSVPRLTTTGRLAIVFGTGDSGMMVYDTTLNNLFIWTGSAWESVPASGDAGINGAVQYNDNGVVSGATNFVYNKVNQKVGIGTITPNVELDVVGNATITGDLTVDANVLKVDSTLNKVGIGVATLTGLSTLNVAGDVAITSDLVLKNGAGTAQGYIFGSSGINYRVITGQPHVWQESGTDLMRLNSTGLGVGVSPAYKLHSVSSSAGATTYPVVVDNAAGGSGINIAGIGFANGGTLKSSITSAVFGNDFLAFNVGGSGTTQRVLIDASGNLLVGTPASGGQNGFCVLRPLSSGVVASTTETAHNFGALTGTTYATFLYATTGIGSITQSGTTGVLYNITSDYRLKESVKPISGGLARVNALKPSSYSWKSDGSTGEGFLAHELAEVVPFAVSGEKDAVNADGTIKSQGIDMSRIVPILVAAIQELTARVQTLEAR